MNSKKRCLFFCFLIVLLVCTSCFLDIETSEDDGFMSSAPGAAVAVDTKSPSLMGTYTANGKEIKVVFGTYQYAQRQVHDSYVYLDVTIDGVTETYVEVAKSYYYEGVFYTFNGKYTVSSVAALPGKTAIPPILQDKANGKIVYLEKYRVK